MISLSDAIARIFADARFLSAEEVPLDEAAGRVLARDIAARWDLPGFDNSAMDGWAVRAADTDSACRERPVRLRVTGRAYADQGEAHRSIAPGEAMYVATGARIPPGADAVVRVEASRLDAGDVLIHVAAERGAHVRLRGEDAPAGRVLLAAGTTIDPAAIGILATFGHVRVPVARRPRLALLAAGDELIPAERADGRRVVDSNSRVLAAQAREAGAQVAPPRLLVDEPEALAAAMAAAAEISDVVVTVGGSSVGERDAARAAFDRLGVDVAFWNVAIKPGKPVGYGRLGRKLIFALPGNPNAASTSFELLVRPAIRALQGALDARRLPVRGRLMDPVRKQPGITYCPRARARLGPAGLEVAIPPRQGAGQLTPALGAGALAILPAGTADLRAGDEIDVVLLAPPRPRRPPPVLCFVGPSGVGKTTLLERVIAGLAADGVRVGALKHDAHDFQMDREGKDTFRLAAAGARAVGIASARARAVLARTDRPTPLAELCAALPPDLDVVLVEGFKGDGAPKIEVHRRGLPRLADQPGIRQVIACVTDDETRDTPAVRFDHDDLAGVCAFVLAFIDKEATA